MKYFDQTKSPQHRTLVHGFTLIELMVGIALGVVIMGGVLAVYVPTIKSWNATSSLAQIHDTESLLHDMFGTGIRQAGLLACGGGNIIDGVSLSGSDRNESANWALTLTDFLKTPFLAFAADSDMTTILTAGAQTNRLRNNTTSGSTVIGDTFFVLAPSRGFYRVDAHSAPSGTKTLTLSSRITTDISFKAGEFFIVNDCDNPVLIRASTDAYDKTYDAPTKTATSKLSYTSTVLNDVPHPLNTVVNVFEPAVYYLRPSASDIPTLYKATISTTSPLSLIHTPIVTGVENLRIEYGIADASGSYIESYETVKGPSGISAADATLSNVLSVRVSVMIRAPGGSSTQSTMSFPNSNGEILYCFKAGESSKTGFADACPDFLFSSDNSDITHKVIQFTYILPRIISI